MICTVSLALILPIRADIIIIIIARFTILRLIPLPAFPRSRLIVFFLILIPVGTASLSPFPFPCRIPL